MLADSGMAFVLVQHLSPDHKSMLVDLLGQATSMMVAEAVDGMSVVANRVFVIPPNATLRICGGILRVEAPAPPREHRRPIDTFFSALADDQGENAVYRAFRHRQRWCPRAQRRQVRMADSLWLRRRPTALQRAGCHYNAVATGFVDEVLPVEEMPARAQSHTSSTCVMSPRGSTRTELGSTLRSNYQR